MAGKEITQRLLEYLPERLLVRVAAMSSPKAPVAGAATGAAFNAWFLQNVAVSARIIPTGRSSSSAGTGPRSSRRTDYERSDVPARRTDRPSTPLRQLHHAHEEVVDQPHDLDEAVEVDVT